MQLSLSPTRRAFEEVAEREKAEEEAGQLANGLEANIRRLVEARVRHRE